MNLDWSRPHVSRRIIVGFKSGVDKYDPRIAAIATRHRAHIVVDLHEISAACWEAADAKPIAFATELHQADLIEYASPDYHNHHGTAAVSLLTSSLGASVQDQPARPPVPPDRGTRSVLQQLPPTVDPNDPNANWSNQWHLDKIQAPLAWALTRGHQSVVLASLDEGILSYDLVTNLAANGYDFNKNSYDLTITGQHGTWTAGLAAADFNNGQGGAGIGANCKVRPLIVVINSNALSDAIIAQAVLMAANGNCRCITMSFGSLGATPVLQSAITYALGLNCICVAAAGNGGGSLPFYPAAYTGVIGVTGTDINDGASATTNSGTWVIMSAPGQAVMTIQEGNSGMQVTSGTSLSAPIVAGTVLLMMAANPFLTSTQVMTIFNTFANNDPGIGQTPGVFSQTFGFGRVNTFKAVKAAIAVGSPIIGTSTAPGEILSTAAGIATMPGDVLGGNLSTAPGEILAQNVCINSRSTAPGEILGSPPIVGADALYARSRYGTAPLSGVMPTQVSTPPPTPPAATPLLGQTIL